MKVIFTIIFSLFCILALYDGETAHFSAKVYITSIIIQIFSLYNIFNTEERPYSLYKMVYMFSFFFFGVSPLIQCYNQSSLFGARILKEEEYFFINILIIFILVGYKFLYYNFSKLPLRKIDLSFVENLKTPTKLSPLQTCILLLLSVFSFFLVFYSNNFSILSMLIRGGEFKEGHQIESLSVSLIVGQFIRPIPMVILFYYIQLSKKNYFVLILLFSLAILTCFPLGMPRFAAASMYIPLLILGLPLFRKQNVFVLSIIFGLLILFPFLNNFRNLSSDQELIFGLDLKMFEEGHFDSYQNFALIVSEDYITWGYQLLGVLFFWVPRSVWPTKPIGSGSLLAEELGLSFSNISANFFAEGYINFGYFGIILFLIFLAFFTARLDKLYWHFASKENKSFFKVIYYILLGMLFFILRGDLLSSVAYTVGFVLAGMVVFKMMLFNKT